MTLLVFGMDGAVDEYVQEAIDRGLMPNLEKFLDEACYGEMESCVPPITIPAWVSMFSGQRPGKLGIYHSTKLDEDFNREPVDSREWQGEMVWDKVDGTFGLVNVPGTSPIWPCAEYVVEGFPRVENPEIYPEELERDLPELDLRKKGDQQTKGLRRKAMFENFQRRSEVFTDIEGDVDVKIEVYQLTDTAAHRSKNLDEVLEAYSEMDEVFGERVDDFEDVLLVSDHGFTHIDEMFYINQWLREKGLLEKRQTGSGVKEKLQSFLAPLAETGLRPVLKFANDLLSKNAGVDFSPTGDDSEEIDFQKSKAFSLRGGGCHYGEINLVEESARSEILEGLEKESFIEWVKTREELYEHPEGMPELVFNTREKTGVGSSMFPKHLLETDAFIHSDTGIVAARGPSFNKGSVENAKIHDIGETVAHYLGQSLGEQGEVLDVFSEEFVSKEPSSGNEVSGIEV